MSDAYKEFLGGSLNPKIAIAKARYDVEFERSHPTYFHPDGFICFCGSQGSGKTLSAVQYIHKLVLQYPNVMLVTNCHLHFPDWQGTQLRYEGYEQVKDLDNGYEGIILFLDEIQSEFNSLESKKIDPSWFTVISQQRKRRLHVVGTSQIFSRIAKPWREQFTAAIQCKAWFRYVQVNSVISMDDCEEDDNGNIQKTAVSLTKFWFRDPALYGFYDTWERVIRQDSAIKKKEVKIYGSK